MNFNFKKVFLTGSSGWLGKQLLVSLLNQQSKWVNFEHKVQIYCLLDNEISKEDKELFNAVNVVYGDIRVKEDCKKFLKECDSYSLLVHAAGVIHPKDIKDFQDVNVKGSKNIIDASLKKSIAKIITISSNSPYGFNKDNIPFNEESSFNPYMAYGKSKMEMEVFMHDKMSSNTNISILCVPWFYGRGMPERQIEFYNMIIKGIFPRIGKGTNIRSVVNVENIIQGIMLCASSSKSKNQKYWIADEKNLSMNEIVETIRDVFEKEFSITTKKPIFILPNIVSQVAGLADYLLQKLGFYNQKIHVLSEMNKNIFCDISKAKSEIGYKPEYSLYKGTFEAYEDYLNKNNHA